MMSMSIMIDGHAVSAGGSDDDDDGDYDEDDDGGVKEVEVLLSPGDEAGRVVIAGGLEVDALLLPGERGKLIRDRKVVVVITDVWKTTKIAIVKK